MPQVFSNVNIVPNNYTRWVLTNELANTRIEIPLTFDFRQPSGRSWSFNLSPFFEYWQDGKSLARNSTGTPLGLPRNTYFFWGVAANLGYAF